MPRDLSLTVTAAALMQFIIQHLEWSSEPLQSVECLFQRKQKKIPDSIKNLTLFHPVEKQRGCGSTNFHIFLASVCIGDRPLFNPADIQDVG